MENAADALKMAAGVLIFVMALSISINAFGEARQTAQIILDNIDREYDYRYIESSTDIDGNIITERTVRGETIVPSIYKAYIENYKIIFKQQKNGVLEEMEIYKRNNKSVTSIDLSKEGLGTNEEKESFLKLLLGGTDGLSPEETIIKKNFEDKGYDFTLQSGGLYAIIKETSFIEKIGVYYEEEINEQYDTPIANRNKKKVITYVKVI